MSESTRDLTDVLAATWRVFDLGRPLFAGMPQSPNHPEFRHVLAGRHGDTVRTDGGSAASDLIITGTHVGTHVDALGHVSQDGRLQGDADAMSAQVGGRFDDHGIHVLAPLVCRGVLLDVPALLGLERCEAGYEISPGELMAAADAQATPVRAGDAVLVRSGWAQHWEERELYQGQRSGAPGPGEAAARWLAEASPAVVGADTIAFEQIPAGEGHSRLPAHRVLLVEHGVNIVETLDLEAIASARVYEFLFVLNPLNIVGATGAPVRPLAVVPGD